MLTIDVLSQNEILKALPVETLQIIETLSEAKSKDIAKKAAGDATRTAYSSIDEVIEQITGKKKQPTQMTSALLKEALSESWQALGEVKTLKETVKGGKLDEAKEAQYKQQLKDFEAKVQALTGQIDTTKTEYEQKINQLAEQGNKQRLKTAFELRKTQLQFKDTYGDAIKELLQAREEKIFNEVAVSSVPDATGGAMEVLRDKNDQILLNPNNGMKPYTFGEFYETKVSDLLDTSRTQTGGGGKSITTASNKTLDLGTVKSQDQASAAVEKYLMQKGISKLSPKFADEQAKIYSENNIMELPISEPVN